MDPELLSIVEDLGELLRHGEERPVESFRGEANPGSIEFVYIPPETVTELPGRSTSPAGNSERSFGADSESFIGDLTGARKSGTQEGFLQEEREGRTPVPPNVRCTLCSDRLFPFRRYYLEGESPVLVLHYSGEIQGKKIGRDLSGKLIFASEEEDHLFERMIRAAGREISDLHFQQYPACLFDPARSMPEDWNDRCRNCMTFIEDTVRRHSIRLLLLTGPSAIFLLGEEMALKLSREGETVPLEFGDRQVLALVLRSPAALIAYEKKRERLRLHDPEGKSPDYRSLVQEEKKVKHSILASLKKAFQVLEG